MISYIINFAALILLIISITSSYWGTYTYQEDTTNNTVYIDKGLWSQCKNENGSTLCSIPINQGIETIIEQITAI